MKQRKITLGIVLLVLIISLSLTFIGCGNNDDNNATPNNPDNTDNNGTNQNPELKEFSGISLDAKSFTYDGDSRGLSVTGAPSDATITYTNNDKTDAGSYTVSAKISKDGYKDLTLNAILTINKATMKNIVFDDDSVEFDNSEHSIIITGNIPTDSTIAYTGGENEKNGATSPGTYEITAVISNKNYETLTLTATLKITSKEEPLNITVFNGQIYFQNPLDQNRLYTVASNGTIDKINNDIPKGFVVVGNKMYYLSSGIFTSGINVFDGEKATNLFEINGDCLTTDGTNLYYAISSILDSEKTGIYSISIADLNSQSVDPTPVKLTNTKSTDLVYANGYIYFSNKSDKGKLYRVNIDSKQTNKVYDHKVSDIIVADNVLYYCKHNMTSAYIERMDVSTLDNNVVSEDSTIVKKLTMSKGKYLTKIGEYIYFVNTDMLTSAIAGDGVYRVKADGSSWIADATDILTGSQKVIATDKDNIYALAANGNSLYYFRTSNKHLYLSIDPLNDPVASDLMHNFVPPVTQDPITTKYLKSQMYKDQMYFINMQDKGRLYKHDFSTNSDIRITNSEVADFVIAEDVLYYATVRLAVNFDLYKLDLINGELVRLSKDKCVNLAVTGDKIYYTNMSGSNTFNVMNTDGTSDTIISENAEDLDVTIVGKNVYFVRKNDLHVYNTETKAVTIVNKNLQPNEYIIHNNKVYYMNDTLTKNSVCVYDLATNTATMLADLGATQDARSFFVYNNEVYFYRNVAAGTEEKGLYKIKADNTVELVDKLEGHFMASALVYNNKLYFIDAWVVKDALPHTDSTGKLCSFDFTSKAVDALN